MNVSQVRRIISGQPQARPVVLPLLFALSSLLYINVSRREILSYPASVCVYKIIYIYNVELQELPSPFLILNSPGHSDRFVLEAYAYRSQAKPSFLVMGAVFELMPSTIKMGSCKVPVIKKFLSIQRNWSQYENMVNIIY